MSWHNVTSHKVCDAAVAVLTQQLCRASPDLIVEFVCFTLAGVRSARLQHAGARRSASIIFSLCFVQDSSSDEDEYSESDELESNDLESQQQRQQPVSLRLTAGGDGTITVALEVHPQHQQQEDVVMMSRDGASGSSSDESEEDSGSSSSSETSSDVESIDYNEMRDFIDKAYKYVRGWGSCNHSFVEDTMS